MKCKAWGSREARRAAAEQAKKDNIEAWQSAYHQQKQAQQSILEAQNFFRGVSAMHAGLANQYAPGGFVPVHDYPRPRPWWKFWGDA
jgi:U3 small nucleolar RNA-associated protein 14